MTKKLFVSDDAPENLKEIVGVGQQMIDNMQEFKVKADNGTLTFDDLEELTKRNNELSNRFPADSKPRPGYPPHTTNMDELEAYGKMRAKESENQLKAEGGSVLNISSLAELEKMSKKDPMILAKMIFDAGKRKTKEKIKKESKKAEEKPEKDLDIKTNRSFEENIFVEYLNEIQSLLKSAKLLFFYRQDDWKTAERFEEHLVSRAGSFEEFRQDGIYFLTGIISGEEVDDETIDKKGEAAYILAAIDLQNQQGLDLLLETWKSDEELRPIVSNALKYSKNPTLTEQLESRLFSEDSLLQAALIEILEYRQAINPERWNRLLLHKDPLVSARIYRAYSNSGIAISDKPDDFLLDKPDEEYFESTILSALISGDESALILARKCYREAIDQICDIPLHLACAGNKADLHYLKNSLNTENARKTTVFALGVIGLTEVIPLLIESISDQIKSVEDWDLQKCLAESLNLITGADLPSIPIPDVIEGPKGKEYEIKVETDLKKQWTAWWYENHNRFSEGVRYRRGKRFNLASCIEEMSYPTGIYWSRQLAYYELQIRSGRHIAPFFADWHVQDQKESIEEWELWWTENRENYKDKQWLFAGDSFKY